MYLTHNTDLKSLKLILIDDLIKASYLTNILNEGTGIYASKNQHYIFFSVIDEFQSKYKIYSNIILYFDPEMLWNRTYYISNFHSPNPHILDECTNGKQYKKKYKQYYKNTKSVLVKLFDYSISILPGGKAFQSFQQIALKKQTNLKYLKIIKFNNKIKPTKVIIKLIKDKYPDVILDF